MYKKIRPQIGDKIWIKSDNENYIPYLNKSFTITHVARSIDEHPGYDDSMKGEALVDCDGLPFSLYEYEFDYLSYSTQRR